MYARMNILAGDPARLGEAERYLQATVRPHVEAQHGNRGMALLANDDLGVSVVTTYWDSADAMAASEQAVQVSRKEVTELVNGTVTVEHYDVPVFVRRTRPQPGAGVRLVRIDTSPDNLDALIEEFRNTAVPGIMEMPGFSSAHLMTDRATGRCVAVIAWQDMGALVASRAVSAGVRASVLAVTHAQFRSVEEYRLGFTSVREGDTRSLIERDIELWNTRDRESMLAAADLHRLEMLGPGGMRLLGREAAETTWDAWHEGFPDNRIETIAIHADARGGMHEGRFIGTHSGTLHGPAGDIPATGRVADLHFCLVYEFDEGKIISNHLYFDQVELLSQLGIAPGAQGSG